MKIYNNTSLNFKRQLKHSEEAEYSAVLREGKKRIGNTGKSILLVHTGSLPNDIGTGNIGTKESLEFLDFAKQYWDINEVQLLSTGQLHEHYGEYPIYSGTSTTLGNQMINIKNYASESEYQELVSQNKEFYNKKINYSNIVNSLSKQEKILKTLHKRKILNSEFEQFKHINKERLEGNALYYALKDIHNDNNYLNWPDIDKNLFNPDVINKNHRNKRICEIYNLKKDKIDFFYFKQFLAEDSLKKAKQDLNKKGLKLNGDLICNNSIDEIWCNPKAFYSDTNILWGMRAINLDSKEGKDYLRTKVKFYLERFDGIRIDASWSYINQPLVQKNITQYKYYKDNILKIIEDEAIKVKGTNYDLKNIMHEFTADPQDFNMFENNRIIPFIDNRMKIFTSEYLSNDFGSNKSFIDRKLNPNKFIIGTRNHDSANMGISINQAKTLSQIFKIPYEKLLDKKEFIKAKLAEPMSAKHNMIFFMDALNITGKYSGDDTNKNQYTKLIRTNYKEMYFRSLENSEGFNPMDGLAKNFKTKGLDKTEPKLYKKILKYKNILENKKTHSPIIRKCVYAVLCLSIVIYGAHKIISHKNDQPVSSM